MTVRASPTEEQLARSRALFAEGIQHYENGRLEPARICFEQCQTLTPGRPSVLGNLGITLFHLRRLEAAIPVLTQATEADPSLAEAWACLGLAHEAQGRWRPAADALEKSLALVPRRHALLWVTLGQVWLRLGDTKNAERAFDRALQEDPSCAPAWSERGNLMRELLRFDEARDCFERALALGADPELNSFYLASIRGGDVPATPPRRYVEGLFDDYAADFQSHAAEKLEYRGYEVLLKPFLGNGRRYERVLDLGCGTGLCGALIAAQAHIVDGVDVSIAMLEEARKHRVYRELVHADLGEFLAASTSQWDLLLAADVFIYVGDLAAILRSARRILAPGGCLAFTVELASEGKDIQLLPSLRYAHSEAYVRRLADAAGFAGVSISSAPIRREQGTPIAGLYVYLE